MSKIAITTSSFGEWDHQPIDQLKRNDFSIVRNEQGRTLKEAESIDLLQGCTGVIAGTEKYSREVLDQLKDLQLISRCGVGTDNVDLEFCQDRGIKVFNTPDVATQAVAELAIGLILNLLRNVSVMNQQLHNQQWTKVAGSLFMGKTIGIIGFGRIGQRVAELSQAFGAHVLYYDPYVSSEEVNAKSCKLKELLKLSDIVTLHVALTDENKHLLGTEEFAIMDKNAILVNCSRGGVVDEEALYKVLKNGQLAGAALDVFEQEPYDGPLVELDNIILTPHIGSFAKEARVKMELAAVQNLLEGFKTLNNNS